MRVSPSQLVPGCVLLKDVIGKSNHPLVTKNTVLTDEHILILQKFLIESVEVSSRLEEGEVFKPKPEEKKDNNQERKQLGKGEEKVMPFPDHYQNAVISYEKIYKQLQSGMAIDMPEVRKLLIPLLERIDEIGAAVFTLHNYATKEKYFYHHSIAVAILSAFIGKQMGYGKGEWLQIGLAGFLSDSGMAKVDPKIATKNNTLTFMEKEEMKKHPTYSYRLVEDIATVTHGVKLAVLQHHERIDGSGYPLGLFREKIHMYARIVAVCDIYHAMTSERLYKEKQSPFKVIEELEKEQFSKLDPRVVYNFISSLTNFSMGTKIKLSNGQIGEIVFIDSQKPARPMVRLDETKEIVSLQKSSDLHIEEVLGN